MLEVGSEYEMCCIDTKHQSQVHVAPLRARMCVIQGSLFRVLVAPQVVLATNIAETSLTIEDVVYVVDTGKLKVRPVGLCP